MEITKNPFFLVGGKSEFFSWSLHFSGPSLEFPVSQYVRTAQRISRTRPIPAVRSILGEAEAASEVGSRALLGRQRRQRLHLYGLVVPTRLPPPSV